MSVHKYGSPEWFEVAKNSGSEVLQGRSSPRLRCGESVSSSSMFLNAAGTLGALTKSRASSPPPMALQARPSPRGLAAPWSQLPAVRSSSPPAHPVDAGDRLGVVASVARTSAAGNALRGRWTVHLSTSCLVVKLPQGLWNDIDRFRPGLRRQEPRASQDNKVNHDFYCCQD